MAEEDKKQKLLVLVAIDGSSESNDAFNFYLDNLHKEGNQVLLIHAAEPPVVASQQGMVMCGEIWEQLLAKEKQKVKELEESYADIMRTKGCPGKIKAVFSSHPGEVIVDTANEEKAKMVVMGTRGLGRLRRTILGSVSDYVVHHAHCPVVVCRH